MRLILHIGLHRAASTSIQQLVTDNAVALRHEGVIAVTQQMANDPGYRIFKDLRGHVVARNGLERTASAFEAWCEREAGSAHSIFYSNENLPGLMPGKRQKAFSHSEDLARLISMLANNHDVEVVAVLREHVGYLRSVFNVRRMRTLAGSFAAFAASIDLESVNFSAMLGTLADAAGRTRLHVFDFEDLRQGRGHALVGGLAELTRSQCLASAQLPVHNRAAPDRQMAVFDALNAAGIFIPFGSARDRLLRATSAIEDLARPHGLGELCDALRGQAVRLPFAIRSEGHLQLANWLQGSGLLGRLGELRERELARALAAAEISRASHADMGETDRALWQRLADDRARIADQWLPSWANLPPPA